MRVYRAKRIQRKHQPKHLSSAHSHSRPHLRPHPYLRVKSSLPSNYLRLKERISRSKSRGNHSCSSLLFAPCPHLGSDEHSRMHRLSQCSHTSDRMSSSSPLVTMTSPLQAYRIRHTLSGNRRNSNESCNDSSSVCNNNNNSNIVSRNDNGSGDASSNSHNGHSAQNVSQDHISRNHADFGCRPTSGPVSNTGFGSDSVSMSSSTSWAPSTEASSLASLPPSPSPLVTPTSEVDPKHNELMMLKHEAFQELASQTQRFDDLFIAKMIYWESLDAEEKVQWLERDQTGNTDRGTEEVEMDELISALDCGVTCKDYSALIAFERQVEAERRQHQMTEHQQRRTC